MENKFFEINNSRYDFLFKKGTKNNDIILIYFHGLEGKAKIVKPLLDNFDEFDFVSMEQRGHINSHLKTSTCVKKHDQDIQIIVNYFKNKYKKVYLLGESMGAVYISRYVYKFNDVDGVFSWSIPFYPKDIIKENIFKKSYIIFRTILTFITTINYKYQSKIDYPKLTNSKFLLKLNELDTNTIRQTSEAVALWKAHWKIKHKMKKQKPQSPIYYWHGENDLMSSIKLIKKLQKNNNINIEIVPNAKHILMYEKNAHIMYEKIKKIINK